MSEQIVLIGGEVKHLGGGRIRGAAVVFTPVGDELDLEGEFFTPESDLGRQKEFPLYMSHGLDPLLGNVPIGYGKIQKDDIAAWFEGQIEIADDYEKEIGGTKRKRRLEKAIIDLVETGKTGMSTQPIQTSVRKEERQGGVWIKSWHIAENSLTVRPAEPKTRGVQSLKTYEESVDRSALKSVVESDDGQTTVNVTVNLGEQQNEAHMDNEQEKAPEQEAKTDEAAVTNGKADDAVAKSLDTVLDRLEKIEDSFKAFESKTTVPEFDVTGAPNYIKQRGGDTQNNAVEHWMKTGQRLQGLDIKNAGDLQGTQAYGGAPVLEAKFKSGDWNRVVKGEWKASNDDEQNVTTDADGGYLVPTGHFGQIIERMAEVRLAERIGVRQITGTGTTVNTPLGGAFTDFVSTAESGTFDRHAQQYGQAVFTKVKYTRDVHVTYELLEDNNSNVLDDLAQYTGQCAGLTHNTLLIAANNAGGTELVTTASSTAIAAGEPEAMVLNANVTDYLDTGAAWMVHPVVYKDVATISSANNFLYSQTPHGMTGNLGNGAGGAQAVLFGYPVWFTTKSASSVASGNHTMHFGAWSFAMGLYEDPTLRVLRDPFSGAAAGEVHFHYYFRADYTTLQAAAGGFMRQITT